MVGWLTKDFEGDTFVKNSIKVKRNVGSTYDYFDIVAFKDTADECRKLKKNSKVAIEGTLQKSKFGETWYYTIVISEKLPSTWEIGLREPSFLTLEVVQCP